MSGAADWPAWLRLVTTPGLSQRSARRLLAAFGTPEQVLGHSQSDLAAVLGPVQAAALLQPPPDWPAVLLRTTHWLAHPRAGEQHAIWTLGDPHYPAGLLELADPPLMLFVQGQLQALPRQVVAVVGSRNPTAQGSDNAHAMARSLGEMGACIVSGLALGIDAAAHQGALAVSPAATALPTVAVVGTGLDLVYPRRNQKLAVQIAQRGLLLSEYPLGSAPLAHHFPQRNRIIAALSQGCLVVEAAMSSGSLITAQLALDVGREVFAVPGSIHSPQSRGCHALIRQGAKLVETAQHVWEELQGWQPPEGALQTNLFSDDSTAQVLSNSADDPVLVAMGWDSVQLEVLQNRVQWPIEKLQAHLLNLELDAQVARMAGGLFQRLKQSLN